MSGISFLPGEKKSRPGVYVRVTNTGIPTAASIPQGIVAAIFKASWGPLGVPTVLSGGVDEVQAVYVSGGTIEAAKEAFRGNAQKVIAYRLGTGGQKASINLKDTAETPADVVKIEAKYAGVVGNDLKLVIRDSLSESGKRELQVYQGTTLRERFTYTAGTDEPQALVDAVNHSNWIAGSKIASGNGSVADVSNQALTGGSDPTATGTDYATALSAVEAQDFNVLVTDSEDKTVHATVQAFVDRVRNDGKRIIGVVGEPTSVDFSDRLTNCKVFNDLAIVYVGNGFKSANGDVEGYKAAARVAGMIASQAITDSLTHATVSGATDLIGAATNAQIEQAIAAGMLVFTFSASKRVQIEYGINTLTAPSANLDDGWKKIRRVRTRDYLIESIVRTWDPLIGKVNNSPDGRATLIAAAQGVINDMVRDGALLGGTIAEDQGNPPAGDSAWFVVQADDLDSAEKLYITFGFRFSPAA
jgi:phage tail sheath gpL-like